MKKRTKAVNFVIKQKQTYQGILTISFITTH